MRAKEILHIPSRVARFAATTYTRYDNRRQLAKLFSNEGKTAEEIDTETDKLMEIKGALLTAQGLNPFFHRDGTPKNFTRMTDGSIKSD